MMQVNEIRQQFNHIEQTIAQAMQACSNETNVPQDLKQCIQQMDQQSNQARQVMQSQDENQIVQCVDNLEELGDRAMRACEQANGISDQVRNAVSQAHRELSDLKHQLH
jgi:phage shock protein A